MDWGSLDRNSLDQNYRPNVFMNTGSNFGALLTKLKLSINVLI
jgi:hypothetical protein